MEGPLSDVAPDLLMAARNLGSRRTAVNLRALASPYLFNAMERVFDAGVDPAPALRQHIEVLTRWYCDVGGEAWRSVSGKRENLDGMLGDRVQLVEADIRNADRMAGLVRGVDVIFHLACMGVRHSIHSPVESHEVNA